MRLQASPLPSKPFHYYNTKNHPLFLRVWSIMFLRLSWNFLLVNRIMGLPSLKRKYLMLLHISVQNKDLWNKAVSVVSSRCLENEKRFISEAQTLVQKWQLILQPPPEGNVGILMIFLLVLDNGQVNDTDIMQQIISTCLILFMVHFILGLRNSKDSPCAYNLSLSTQVKLESTNTRSPLCDAEIQYSTPAHSGVSKWRE